MHEPKTPNELLVLRRARGLSRKQVCDLLGYKCPSAVRRLEQGTIRPTLDVALRLEILYRKPVAYIYPDFYKHLRSELREREERLPQSQMLPLGEGGSL